MNFHAISAEVKISVGRQNSRRVARGGYVKHNTHTALAQKVFEVYHSAVNIGGNDDKIFVFAEKMGRGKDEIEHFFGRYGYRHGETRQCAHRIHHARPAAPRTEHGDPAAVIHGNDRILAAIGRRCVHEQARGDLLGGNAVKKRRRERYSPLDRRRVGRSVGTLFYLP